ncbi:hypothetical protein BD749_2836 [Pontibacter ramchanderi]|uniref:Uncharacterized protein n=1 Tax=Pontibacter ramchanderi TaxID=1179743 RepID=A0A2N3U8C5_9BACT|nr:hypothetical protein BD749_2836 [Pontibacter ramchanderi]
MMITVIMGITPLGLDFCIDVLKIRESLRIAKLKTALTLIF